MPNSRRLVPEASSAAARRRMLSTRQAGTAPEAALRNELIRLGLDFEADVRPSDASRSRADFLFLAARIALFVDGCFWHGCPQHGTWPKANGAWWRTKIKANIARDRDTDARLRAAGWAVFRIW